MTTITLDRSTLYRGDCREVLKTLSDASIDAIVTDPPYELGFMGRAWDRSGIAYDVSMWAECLRVLKPGGHLLAFSGSRTYHRMACAIEDAGFELRDQIMWLYGSGFPKSKNLEGDWAGWGTALKPAHEPICVARKPLVGTVAANVLEHGTGALNIDACRVPHQTINGGNLADNPHLRGTKLRAAPVATSFGREGDETPLTDASGRWPANVIHDGSDEVLAAFPDAPGQQHASCDAQRTRANTYGAVTDNGKIYAPRLESATSAARFFYCAKASRADRNEGCDALPDQKGGMNSNTSGQHITRRDGWESEPVKNNHPTVKPTDLMCYLVRLVTPPGGTVLDPFMGSGSTGKACAREGFAFIGIEKDEDESGDPLGHIEIARSRIEYELGRVAAEAAERDRQPDLFQETA
ncbi:DNA-methyltransferase [Burkholderia diffusa]|uniref:DNA-methyltransferase n=1 Tax=Burkholderia diffusa TaxID=488732 RepID=UPI00075C5010|nr:site-specific DNA-methyltransferase [Burkholderia diffusa]KVG33844.1 hypothetical protein WJ30_07165 [Burkholderia diffusa]